MFLKKKIGLSRFRRTFQKDLLEGYVQWHEAAERNGERIRGQRAGKGQGCGEEGEHCEAREGIRATSGQAVDTDLEGKNGYN